ncbi:Zn-dependent dipeptidase, microsomal dipeptidase [Aequorivita sublithincola DSM 14238]|uniref:Zn-dependent dipeptidase, microsomal dipeptidase n=1 Tax=Aequorivita sublithincola (strain DSM 14238 / LMG 21431 / ACAM 643 / 9-3) TaxID=746697 RepID=I3YT13_AEQSU|nr:dipeptidase [Aequorivita sublithincola]AFL80131.1 Zn-dependent dipeptidase, microsomal dipeptidase [Aequorivita sublithincola DSM 14238]
MKTKLLLISLLATLQLSAQNYQKIHNKAILVDTHNDFLTQTMEKNFVFDSNLEGRTHSDLNRMKEGGLDVQFFSVWSDGERVNPYAFANRQIDSLDAVIKRNPDKIVKVANSKELLKAVKQKKIAAFIGVEGGHQFENDLGKLEALYNRGVRYITLTWNNSTPWATSAADETNPNGAKNSEGKKGLTAFGKQVVQKMNSLGMLVDVSHVGEQTFYDVIATTTKPVIASHSSVYAICSHPRNLKYDQIKAIAKNGGVIQINFNSGFIDPTVDKRESAFLEKHQSEIDSLTQAGLNPFIAQESIYVKYADESQQLRAPFEMVIQHIEYVINLVGVDYVGIGSDFDGIFLPPKQLDDVTDYPLITKALVEKGYSEKDIDKILGGNLLRVLKANE